MTTSTAWRRPTRPSRTTAGSGSRRPRQLPPRLRPRVHALLDLVAAGARPVEDRPPHARLGVALQALGAARRCVDRDRDVVARARAQGGYSPQQLVVVDHVGHPTVAEAQHAILDRRTVAADPHRRMGVLDRLRPRPDAVEAHVLSAIRGFGLGPYRLDRLDALAHDRHPHPRVGAVVAHLLAVPAGADAELHAPAAEQ